MNILVRLSPALVYGDKLALVEILGDRVGLSVSDIHDLIVGWIEYAHFNTHLHAEIESIVETCFMGESMGRDLLYAVAARVSEIMAYIPDQAENFGYLMTSRDGFYLLCGIPDEPITDF